MHTFTDWELRQLLEDTLTAAYGEYRAMRACVDKTRGLHGKRQDWLLAAIRATEQAMETLWFDRTRPAAAQET